MWGSLRLAPIICLWGDYFHERRVKLPIANVGNGRQARVRTAKGNGQGKLYLLS